MDPYLIEVARDLETYDDAERINHVLDELEFLYDALDDEQQQMTAELISRLQQRLKALG